MFCPSTPCRHSLPTTTRPKITSAQTRKDRETDGKLITRQDAVTVDGAEKILNQLSAFAVVATTARCHDIAERVVPLWSRDNVLNDVIVFVELGQTIEALPALPLKDELPVFEHREEVLIFESRIADRECQRHDTGQFAGKVDLNASAVPLAAQNLHTTLLFEGSELFVDHSFGWRRACSSDAERELLTRRLEANYRFAFALKVRLSKQVEVDRLFVDIKARRQVVLKLREDLRELVHAMGTT